jgi:hypothetical protein
MHKRPIAAGDSSIAKSIKVSIALQQGKDDAGSAARHKARDAKAAGSRGEPDKWQPFPDGRPRRTSPGKEQAQKVAAL